VVDANELVMGMQDLLRRTIGEDIVLDTKLATDLSLIEIDPGRVEQILMNLAVNSRDAMPHGGTLSVETSNVRVHEYLARQHPGLRAGDHARISVRDTGSGMSAEVLEHIFETFFTTKEEGRGTGLGLATVRTIVDRAGGCITVDSELGIGTVFHIYLPCAENGIRDDIVDGDAAAPRGHGETVLVVEDEDEVRELAQRILERNDYEVLTARSGKEALELCSDLSEPIRLLLSDVVMPQMSGRELARWLRHTGGDFETIFMSGYTSDTLAPYGFEGSEVPVLHKPFTAETLLREVHERLSRQTPTGDR
jgi:two-component system, cell cycle sensor histidine kinase and response regulator CckA